MTTPPRRRALLISLAAPLAAALLAGCVDLPTNSAVITDTSQPTANAGEDVRIWPDHGPSSTDRPRTIVEGFLQTAASDEPDREPATAYLSGRAHDTWDPKKVVVFSSENSVVQVDGQPDEYEMKAVEVGQVDDNGMYTAVPVPTPTSYFFHVSYDKKNGYRIDSLPPGFGIALTQEAFRSYYTPYNIYYLNSQSQTSSMIPIPFYKRSALGDPDAAYQLAKTLLAGAPAQYEGVAQVALDGLQLVNVAITQSEVAQVTIKAQSVCIVKAHAPCDRLAEELLATFVNLGSISSVQVFDQGLGSQVAIGQASRVDLVMAKYHVTINAQKQAAADLYYLEPPAAKNDPNAGHVMVSRANVKNATPVQVGPANLKYKLIAVGTDAATKLPAAALVDANGANLYLAALGSSAAPTLLYNGGTDIRSLSWDAFGHLWFIATVLGQPTLFRVDAGAAGAPQSQQVIVEFPAGGGQLQHVSAAPDGRRIALVYTADAAGDVALSIGIELGSGSHAYVDLSGGAGEPIVGQWATIKDVEWNSSQTLAVLGSQQSTTAPTISEVYTDGSPVFTLPDLNAVTVNPPISTASIAWTAAGGLVAAYSTGQGQDTAYEMTVYSGSNSSWDPSVSGISPSYAY